MIKIAEIIGKKIAISTEDANKVNKIIVNTLKKDKKAIVSFEGIEMLISHFLNESIGKLYLKFDEKDWKILDENIEYVKLSDDDRELLKDRVIPAYKETSKDKEKVQNIQKEILK